VQKDEIKLIGIILEKKTTNTSGQSAIDCGNLWQKFLSEGIANLIPGKIKDEILAVYFNYEGDYTKPFSYFIGCRVSDKQIIPNGLTGLIIPALKFQVFSAKGRMPECIAKAWENIWKSNINRAYRFDYEVYGEKSLDFENAEIEIFLSVL